MVPHQWAKPGILLKHYWGWSPWLWLLQALSPMLVEWKFKPQEHNKIEVALRSWRWCLLCLPCCMVHAGMVPTWTVPMGINSISIALFYTLVHNTFMPNWKSTSIARSSVHFSQKPSVMEKTLFTLAWVNGLPASLKTFMLGPLLTNFVSWDRG